MSETLSSRIVSWVHVMETASGQLIVLLYVMGLSPCVFLCIGNSQSPSGATQFLCYYCPLCLSAVVLACTVSSGVALSANRVFNTWLQVSHLRMMMWS